ncbi:uncharacterized protein ACNLHF_003283 isoform 2-T2 [Anomaloglossus baeobatrachus]
MLRSAGLFRLLSCPCTSEGGGCSRPHCQFRHVAPGTSWEPKGDGDNTCKNLQELERIKKAIEAVKNEVEEKQKTLLLYTNGTQNVKDHAVKVDSNCNIEEKVEKLQNPSRKAIPVSTKGSNPIVKKYIVDRSCPATDLEYDPLLNYSAGFFGSTTKEKGNEKHPKPKRTSEELENTQKRPRAVSPIRLEIKLQESDDEDMLVIDVPPLVEVSKKPRASKVCGIKETLLLCDTTVPDERIVPSVDTVQDVILAPVESNVDVKSDSVNETLPFSITVAPHDNGQFLDSSNNFTSSELDSSSDLKGLSNERPINIGSDENVNPCCAVPIVVESDSQPLFQEALSNEIELLHDEAKYSASNDKAAEVTMNEHCSDPMVIEQRDGEQVASSIDDEVIVVNSSSDTENTSDEESGLSDSDDPIEECRRIFYEFTENEAKKKSEQSQDQSEIEIQESRESDLIPGQRKRVAHPTPKCEVKTSSTILVPFRGTTTQQMPHSRIIHVQQQALQITSAIKNGQAVVSASQKRISSSLTPALHNFGQMVEVQPVLPARSQLSGLVQASTCIKTLMPQKRTMPTPPMKALAEEKSIYDRCGSKNMYLNIAVNSLKKLRDQHNVQPGVLKSGRKMKGGSKKQIAKNELAGSNLYNLFKDYLLSDDQLIENGYPRPHPDRPGSALIHCTVTKTIGSDALRRVCSRCGETYSVTPKGKHQRKEECIFHSGRVLRHKVPGGMETRYSCCEAAVGTPGCQMAKLHVHDGQKENLDGFVKTFVKLQPSDGNPGIFSVDCEMCYTTHGLELSRVTVVDPGLQVVYDTFVKPDNEIIDYNTRFSGVTEENLKNITTSIRDVQAIMLNLFSTDTILIGHGLENDLLALKLFHDTVVDTSIVFPHRLGLPYKRALRSLIADYLRRIIQDEVGGHDSSEDATACMELMIWKVKEDTKGRR